jgi:uncharacterized membrane protein
MARVEQQIDVDVPINAAYDQWTQFEEFPRFMDGVKRVVQLDDKHLTWEAEIGGQKREWMADIVDQVPNQRIAWRSTSGERNDGAVVFESLGANETRIRLTIDFEPDGALENVGTALGVVDRRVKGDLERFKGYIEQRGQATGSWGGEIHGDRVERR